MKRYRQVAGYILAGGASSRMGRDKGLLDFGGVPLILHTARLLEPLVVEVTVVGSTSQYASLGLHIIPDKDYTQALNAGNRTGTGPLAGIATALSATHLPWNLIVACDLPYLSAKWLGWLLSRSLVSRSEAIIPRTERGIEPIAAVYRSECGAPIVSALARGVRKVSDAVAELRVELVAPREWRQIESSELVLKNMNAPSDYEEARRWWSANRLSESEQVKKTQLQPKRKRRSVPRPRK